MDEQLDTFELRLRWARKKSLLTQRELANRIGVNQSAVSRWETGADKPELESIVRIAETLRRDAGWLAFGDSKWRRKGPRK